MENLQDFRFYFADEKEIDAFVATDDTLGDQEQKIQTARMRRESGRTNCEMKITAPPHQQQNWMISLRREPSGRSNCSSGRDTG